MDSDTLDWPDLPEISLSDASSRLSSIAEQAHARATYLTRLGRPVAALVSPQVLARLVADVEELADLRAADVGARDAIGTTLISWEEARAALGVSA
ncbi:type II toxin-antitoxin system Phd/YefM family antitoxin [Microbacterium foliorum]